MSTRGRHGANRRSRHSRRTIAFGLASVLVMGACSSDDATTSSSTNTTTTDGGTGTTPGTDPGTGPSDPTGVQLVSGLRLSAGHAIAAPPEPLTVVAGTPIDDATAQAVIGRLPAWTTGEALTEIFRWPVESRPVPRAGATVDVAFPAPDQPAPPEVPTGPLHVLRSQPNGDVAIAPFASITFDQPMVPIATVSQLDAAEVPATISPTVPGRWQWIGTSTLRFDATSDVVDRLPMATDFTITVPAGTTSATGGVLADDVTFSFSTPPVTVQSFSPTGESLPLTPIFLAAFDQRVDPQAVLATVHLTADRSTDVAVRLATPDEIAADDSVSATIGGLPEGRWIAFRPVDPLSPDTAIDIEIGPDTPSAEGPRPTTSAASYSGRTYAPLRVASSTCGYGAGCIPGSDFSISFNNALDPATFDPATVTVEPFIPGVIIGASYDSIIVHGASQARTKYTIHLPATLTDTFGQTLGADDTVTFSVGAASPLLQQFTHPLTTLDPLTPGASLSIGTVNHSDVRVRVFEVAPSDWPAYVGFFVNSFQNDLKGGLDPPWTPSSDSVVKVANDRDHLVETKLDLGDALAGTGHVVVLVEPTEQYDQNDPDYWNNRPSITWVQQTTIGLDTTRDADQLQVWATDLRDGTPLADVSVQLFGDANPSAADGPDGGNAGPSDPVVTGADGLATMALTDTARTLMVATEGDDTAILPTEFFGGWWQRSFDLDNADWYVFDDRGIYRPGETVSMKGWVRRFTAMTDAQLQLPDAGSTVSYAVSDPQGNQLATGTAEVGPLGGFDLTFVVPADANLGAASVQFSLGGNGGLNNPTYGHSFQIEEFRRPEYEVTARPESEGPFVQGDPLTVAVDADYYAGGPLGASPVEWNVTTASATYAPPGWDEFEFGRWTPWWYATDSYGGSGYPTYAGGVANSTIAGPCCDPSGDSITAQYAGTTDANGTNYLQIDVGSLDADRVGLPVTVSAQATVTDVNRQALASTTNVLVHPADDYVGLRGERTYVGVDEPISVDAVVTDVDGAAVAGRSVHVTSTRSVSVFAGGEWVDKQADLQTCDLTSTLEPLACTLPTSGGGTYTITAIVTDETGRQSRTELTRWVSGQQVLPTRAVEQETLTLVPDQVEYAPGDTAQLLVQSPFATGHGTATTARAGHILTTKTFDVVDGSAVLAVPVADTDIPGIDLTIEVVGSAPRSGDDGSVSADAPARPAYATGTIGLDVSIATRTLTVAAVPQADTVLPGGATQVDVTVTDHAGAPVAGSELAVVVVDEAVLALTGRQLDDPLATFYADLPSYLSTQYGRSTIVLADPTVNTNQNQDNSTAATTGDTTAAVTPESTPAAEAGGALDTAATPSIAAGDSKSSTTGQATTAIDVRTNFDALAVFEPSVLTDAAGHATIAVPLPDNLTRYRVMVVAVADADHFGSAEANITARLPLMVRPSAPRFANFGDTFELPVVVQNQTDSAMDVDVVLQTDNLVPTGDLVLGNADPADPAAGDATAATAATSAGQRVTVPANDRVEVRFPVWAAQAGTARFRVAVADSTAGSEAADAATVELPVYTPATAEAFATYGVIDDGATLQPVATPTDVIAQFGGLDISTSSTSLQALTDAVLYIADYPYRSSDAMASRILAIASLRDVLGAFDAPGLPSPDELDQTVVDDIAGLVALQNGDGGFAYWQLGKPSDPYNTIQATHALVVAEAGGFDVPQSAIDSALGFLADIEQRIPVEYGQDARDTLSAYALNVRMLAGDRDPAKADTLFESRRAALPLDAIAWLWPVVDGADTAAIETIIQNRAVDTAGAVTFTTAVGDDDYVTLRSDRRTDGLILDALIAVRPQSDLIPKVVAGLLAGQSQGRWDNIQENSFILLALKRYFDTYESQTPDFVARIWLGDRFAGEQSFVGRSTDRVRITVPTADLIATATPGQDAGLVIEKDGTGRLYYRIGLRTAPADLRVDPLDRGFVVQRTYEAVDDPSDVTRDPDGTWHIRAGAQVRVRLTMVAESQRTHVALIDPLPAGLEVLNDSLATSPDAPLDPAAIGGGDGGGYSDMPSAAADYSYSPWYPTWFDHENRRDDRVEAFSTFLGAGTYDYSYVATATTPGTFVVPPTRAEEMYAPETFGRAGTDTVVIGG